MNLKKSIERGLLEKGMSKAELASELNITPTTLSRILKRGTCSIQTLEDLAEVFEVKVNEFIRWGE